MKTLQEIIEGVTKKATSQQLENALRRAGVHFSIVKKVHYLAYKVGNYTITAGSVFADKYSVFFNEEELLHTPDALKAVASVNGDLSL